MFFSFILERKKFFNKTLGFFLYFEKQIKDRHKMFSINKISNSKNIRIEPLKNCKYWFYNFSQGDIKNAPKKYKKKPKKYKKWPQKLQIRPQIIHKSPK